MSGLMVTRVLELPLTSLHSPVARFVLATLASYANDEGRQVFPSVATVTKRTGLTRRTVQRALRVLETAGFVVEEHAAGRYRSRRLRLCLVVPVDDIAKGVTVTPMETVKGVGVTPMGARTGDSWASGNPPRASAEERMGVTGSPDPSVDPSGSVKDPKNSVADATPFSSPADGFRVLSKLAHELLDTHPTSNEPTADLAAELKDRAASLHIPYDSRSISAALGLAAMRRRHRASRMPSRGPRRRMTVEAKADEV